jgi:hypothetical protein
MTKPKKSPKQGIEVLAYHEAGHTVAYFELGAKIRKVTIRPAKDYGRRCFPLGQYDSDSYGETHGIRKRAEREIIARCAGKVAADRFRGTPSRGFNSRDDLHSIFAIAPSVVTKEEI